MNTQTPTPYAGATPIHSSNRTRVAVNALPCGGREIVTSNTALSMKWVNGVVWIAFAMRSERVALPDENAGQRSWATREAVMRRDSSR